MIATTSLMLVIGGLSHRAVRALLEEDFERDQANLVEQLAVALALPAWNFDREQIERVIEGALRNENVTAVTVRLVMPSCASRVVKVAPIIAYGKPDEMPSSKAASGALSAYGRSDSGRESRQREIEEVMPNQEVGSRSGIDWRGRHYIVHQPGEAHRRAIALRYLDRRSVE
eukprot:gene7405-10009_t